MSAPQPLSAQGNDDGTERICQPAPVGLTLEDSQLRWSALMLGGEGYKAVLSRHGRRKTGI